MSRFVKRVEMTMNGFNGYTVTVEEQGLVFDVERQAIMGGGYILVEVGNLQTVTRDVYTGFDYQEAKRVAELYRDRMWSGF